MTTSASRVSRNRRPTRRAIPDTNRKARRGADALIKEITARRADSYEGIVKDLADRGRAEVTETYWLVKAILATMPLDRVEAVAERQDILYIQPRYGG